MPAKKQDTEKSTVVKGVRLNVGLLDSPTGEFDAEVFADEILDGKFGYQYHIGVKNERGAKFHGYYKLGQDEETGDIYIAGQLKGVYQALSEVFGDEVSGFGEGELIGKRAVFEYEPAFYTKNGKEDRYAKDSLLARRRLPD